MWGPEGGDGVGEGKVGERSGSGGGIAGLMGEGWDWGEMEGGLSWPQRELSSGKILILTC